MDRFVFNKKQAVKLQTKVNEGVRELNQLITAYNRAGASEQAGKLESIVYLMDTLIYVISKSRNPVLKSKVKDFRKDLKQTFVIIKEEWKLLFEEKHQHREVLSPPTTLAEFIDKMSKDEVKLLTDILIFNDNASQLKDELRGFYPKGHVNKEAFDVFLATHHIELLHDGNSKNFTVNKLGTTETTVLKVEYLDSNGNAAEIKLRGRAELAEVFTSHFAQKPITYLHHKLGLLVEGNLVVTEFCTGSNVEAYGQDFKDDDGVRLKGAADVFTQMSDILMKIEAAGCAFPDMKATNWLLDSSGKLRVADGKSFVFTNAAGEIPLDTSCVISEYMCAPEQLDRHLGRKRDITADNMHAYLLAKNLYHYLVRGDDDFLYDGNRLKNNASEFDFSSPIFKTTVGKQYKVLIESALKTDPNKRLSVSAFQTRIGAIHASYKQAETPTVDTTAKVSINASQDYKTRILETRQDPDVDPVSDETPKFQ
ncbi:MAG: hypothetical protein P1U36_06715 [Legionellaceae bacterium]|nr:hypothetical protein [Legionellaceae bacterium]